MCFLRRLLATKFYCDEFKNVQNLDEVIKMTYTFIDYEKEKAAKEGEKKGKLELITNMIKKGILTLKQAAEEMNMTIPQLEIAMKELSNE